MRNLFEFYGVKTPIRRELQKTFLAKENIPDKSELEAIIRLLWDRPQRELQYFAQELVFKYYKDYDEKDISLFEDMITHKSWWDTVDFIAAKPVGKYFIKFPEQIGPCVQRWLSSEDIWLQRTALLFQLTYKEKTNTVLLTKVINSLTGTDEFFINKAIGWILRSYAKVNPEWVKKFVKQTTLHPLSKREALKNL